MALRWGVEPNWMCGRDGGGVVVVVVVGVVRVDGVVEGDGFAIVVFLVLGVCFVCDRT